MQNHRIRQYAKSHGVYLWEIAQQMSVSEMTITRKLRKKLSDEDTLKIMSYIDEIAAEKEKEV